MKLRAPFPWFGGKSKVSHLVWDRFGDCRNYVEPFAGSLAVLLARPTEPKIETVNDLYCWIANFWRSLQHDPEQVAHHADWPVNEADLHARHLWLVKQTDFREHMKTDASIVLAAAQGAHLRYRDLAVARSAPEFWLWRFAPSEHRPARWCGRTTSS